MRAPLRHRSRVFWGVAAVVILAVTTSAPASGSDHFVARGSSGLEESLAIAVERYEALSARVQALDIATARTERRVRRLALEMLELEKKARRAAVHLYKSGPTPVVEGLLDMDLSQLEETLSYLESSARFRISVFQKLDARQGRLDAVLDRLEIALDSAEEARAQMAAIQADIRERLESARAQDSVVAQAAAIATAEPPPEPAVPGPPYNADWDAIAMCESGGNWHLNSTYDGGLQFHPMTWLGYGGGRYARYAWQASREEQIAIGEKVLEAQGPDAWPHCYQE